MSHGGYKGIATAPPIDGRGEWQMTVSFTDAPLGCSLDAHRWVAAMTEDGAYYETCSGCGRQTAWTAVCPGSPA